MREKESGRTWWGKRWNDVLASFDLEARLDRARIYARSARVLDCRVGPGLVEARVQGSRFTPYRVRITVKTFAPAQWEKVTAALAGRAIFASRLLAGEMTPDIEDVFRGAGISLFPSSRQDINSLCDCSEKAKPCAHIACVYTYLGRQFDLDPFLLFQLRGMSREEFLAAMRRDYGGRAGKKEKGHAREENNNSGDYTAFWAAGEGLEQLQFQFTSPEIPAAPLKRLGALSLGWNHSEAQHLLERCYMHITKCALKEWEKI